jgi:thioredoxin reductase (NADPH)
MRGRKGNPHVAEPDRPEPPEEKSALSYAPHRRVRRRNQATPYTLKDGSTMRDLVIIGSGPAGFTAATYAARANLAPLVVASSVAVGGELVRTTEVENFPGFPEGIMGPDLMEQMQEQAERFGAEIVHDDVTAVELDGEVKRILLGNGQAIEARTVIVATGAAYRKLGLADEARLSGRGVSWCATCDGAFFRNREVVVVGGGDAALEEALFLTRFAAKVHVVHRRDTLRASKILQERAFANDRIAFIWNATVSGVLGTSEVEGVELTDVVSGERRILDVAGVFVAIGHDPRVHLVQDQLDLTREGTIAVHGRTSRTNLPGVFAAGDVIDPHYRQAVTAAASGAVAALDAERFLAAQPTFAPPRAARSSALPDSVAPPARPFDAHESCARESDGDSAMSSTRVRVFGADWCGDCRRTKKQLTELAVPFDYIDIQRDEAAAAQAREISGRTNIPVVVYPDGSHHVEPSNAEVETRLRALSLL